jgi:hypothetical protein
LIQVALRGRMGNAFQEAILDQQEKWIEQGQFWPAPTLSLSPPDRFFMRTLVCQYQLGCFLQVIQIPAPFGDFPRNAFGSPHPLSADASKSLVSQIERFWDFTSEREDVRASATVLVMSGWGAFQYVDPAINDAKAPPGWQFIAATFAELLVMGVVPDMKFDDVLRVLRQRDRLAADGFKFLNLSGALNLLGLWKATGGNLIPEHFLDAQPPMVIVLPTDALLPLRIDCARRRDRRTLPLPGGGVTVVERLERSEENAVQPIYVSVANVKALQLSAAVAKVGRVWWLVVTP